MVYEPEQKLRVTHPNREKAASHSARFLTILLLLASAGVSFVIAVGGWSVLEGGLQIQIFYIIVYVVLAIFVARWNSGVLPVAASLAVIFAIFAMVAAPDWFSRDKSGFEEAALPDALLGMLTLLEIPLQALLVGVAMWAFSQDWHVELEHDDEPAQTTRNPAPAGI